MRSTSLALHACFAQAVLSAHWQPSVSTTWQITLSEPITAPPRFNGIDALEGDLFDTPAATWSSLKSQGYHTICYFSAGSYEAWRPDADQFDAATDLGAPLAGWDGEWWLDTNSANVRRIMRARLDLAVQLACDAVDPDNMDAYDNSGGGLALTSADAIDYVRFLAREAHARGLAIGLKNAASIVPAVVDRVDFAVNEQCVAQGECETFRPFIEAGKPVLGIEYTEAEGERRAPAELVRKVCRDRSRSRFSTIIKNWSLDGLFVACDPAS